MVAARRLFPTAVAVAATVVSFTINVAPASAARLGVPYDFDGNGHPDLVVGADLKQIGSVQDAGAVVVLPASAAGLSSRSMLISQASPGVPGAPEYFDLFGSSVASADFNRDGYADLAIGAKSESIGSFGDAGAVTVVYGSAQGLKTATAASFLRPGGSAAGAFWGSALVAGDFNGDGYPDLAVGAPGDVRSATDPTLAVGSVHVLPGGSAGLSESGALALGPQPGIAAEFDAFGAQLATGDLDGDGDADLVVGASGHEVGETGYHNGSVSYCLGQRGGPTACRRLASGDDLANMGQIAVGNMSGGPRPEIVVGTWYFHAAEDEVLDPHLTAGSVQILELDESLPITVGYRRVLKQSSPGVPGSDESNDLFGYSVTLSNLDLDGFADLVVGAPGEDGDRGRVTVVHGALTGWRTSGNCSYDQNTPGVPGTAELYDSFGVTVALFDHDDDGHPDLTVGANGENHSGAVTTLRGSSGCGFTTNGSRSFGLATLGYDHRFGADFAGVLGRNN